MEFQLDAGGAAACRSDAQAEPIVPAEAFCPTGLMVFQPDVGGATVGAGAGATAG